MTFASHAFRHRLNMRSVRPQLLLFEAGEVEYLAVWPRLAAELADSRVLGSVAQLQTVTGGVQPSPNFVRNGRAKHTFTGGAQPSLKFLQNDRVNLQQQLSRNTVLFVVGSDIVLGVTKDWVVLQAKVRQDVAVAEFKVVTIRITDEVLNNCVAQISALACTLAFAGRYADVLLVRYAHVAEAIEDLVHIAALQREVTDNEVLARRNNRVALDEVQLKIAKREPCSEAVEIWPGDLLQANDLTIECRRTPHIRHNNCDVVAPVDRVAKATPRDSRVPVQGLVRNASLLRLELGFELLYLRLFRLDNLIFALDHLLHIDDHLRLRLRVRFGRLEHIPCLEPCVFQHWQ